MAAPLAPILGKIAKTVGTTALTSAGSKIKDSFKKEMEDTSELDKISETSIELETNQPSLSSVSSFLTKVKNETISNLLNNDK